MRKKAQLLISSFETHFYSCRIFRIPVIQISLESEISIMHTFRKFLKSQVKYEVSARSRQTNHCLSPENDVIKISWNIASSCQWNICDQLGRSPSRAIIGNPIESQKETWYEQMWKAEKISEVKDEKYLRMFINPEQLSTAFESGEYLFAIQDIWGDNNIEGQCSVGKGVRMKIEK